MGGQSGRTEPSICGAYVNDGGVSGFFTGRGQNPLTLGVRMLRVESHRPQPQISKHGTQN